MEERRTMEREAGIRFKWFGDGLRCIDRIAPILWYRGRAPIYDYIEMEAMCGTLHLGGEGTRI